MREMSERAFEEFRTALRIGVYKFGGEELAGALDCFEHGNFEDAAFRFRQFFDDGDFWHYDPDDYADEA